MPKAPKIGHKPIHPKSRKASQLSRKEHHNLRVERRKEELNIKQQLKLKKLKWFKENIDEEKTLCTAKDMKDLIEKYLHRFDKKMEEKEEVNSIKGRKFQEHMKEQYSLKFNIEREIQDFETSGIEVPNLMKKRPCELFLKWNGDSKYLPALEIIVLSKKTLDAQISKIIATSENTTDVEVKKPNNETQSDANALQL